jgi:hypothetical protein
LDAGGVMEAKEGRPLIYTPERIEEIKILLEDYIDDEDVIVPIVAEFAYKNKIRRQSLYEHEEFSDTLKRLKDPWSLFLKLVWRKLIKSMLLRKSVLNSVRK